MDDAVERWARGILAIGQARLRARLSPGLRMAACDASRRGAAWQVRVTLGRGDLDGGWEEATGTARAAFGPGWPPGDPRARRRLQLALAAAFAEAAVAAGVGVGVCRWRLRRARRRPPRADGGAVARTSSGCG